MTFNQGQSLLDLYQNVEFSSFYQHAKFEANRLVASKCMPTFKILVQSVNNSYIL